MNKAAADGRSLTLCDILCCPSEFHTRQQIRSVHRMDQNYGADCLAICLCWCCAICQDAREIEIRSKIIYLGYPPQTMPAK
jgi:Cys-rich protein (TIGR01571 family)